MKAGRRTDVQLVVMGLLWTICMFLPLYAASEGLISWTGAIALALCSGTLCALLDAATIRLVPAEPRRLRLRNVFLFVGAVVVVDIAIVPVVAYLTAIKPSNCRDWSQTLRTGRTTLNACHDPKQRYYTLGDTAKAAAELHRYEAAQRYATELLSLAPAYRRDWNYGTAIHDGHMVLGRVALARGDGNTARRELLLAGASPGSPQLNSFGPNMSLARDLLRAGERETVFEYFDECARFWEFGRGPMKRWKTLARFHLPPDFGINLLY